MCMGKQSVPLQNTHLGTRLQKGLLLCGPPLGLWLCCHARATKMHEPRGCAAVAQKLLCPLVTAAMARL